MGAPDHSLAPELDDTGLQAEARSGQPSTRRQRGRLMRAWTVALVAVPLLIVVSVIGCNSDQDQSDGEDMAGTLYDQAIASLRVMANPTDEPSAEVSEWNNRIWRSSDYRIRCM